MFIGLATSAMSTTTQFLGSTKESPFFFSFFADFQLGWFRPKVGFGPKSPKIFAFAPKTLKNQFWRKTCFFSCAPDIYPKNFSSVDAGSMKNQNLFGFQKTSRMSWESFRIRNFRKSGVPDKKRIFPIVVLFRFFFQLFLPKKISFQGFNFFSSDFIEFVAHQVNH